MTGDAVARTTEQCELGEGIRWDARRRELLRVDILVGRIFRDRIIEDGVMVPVQTHQVPGTVGAVAPVADDEGLLLAAERGFSYLRPEGELRPLAEVAPAGTRMNDAACDPQGRFWAGTVAHDQRAGGASLYRLDRTGHTEEGRPDIAAYVDPAMVVLVSVAFLVVPFRLIIGGLREVLSMSPSEEIQAQLRSCVDDVQRRYRLQESFVRAAKVGGRMDIEVDFVVGPDSTVATVADCDTVRTDLHERLAPLGYERSLIVAFTTDRRWAE